jgi:DNA-directed RNA polymerase specialized sigma24 family protein
VSDLPDAPCAEYWPEVYRFAFLMTGNAVAARKAAARAIEQAAGRIGQIRDQRQARCWLFAQARDCCSGQPPSAMVTPSAGEAAPDDPSLQTAKLFALLPEQERCALALFYLYLFEPEEIADLMEIKPAALGPLLRRAREMLLRHRGLCEDLLNQAASRRQPLLDPMPAAADSAD